VAAALQAISAQVQMASTHLPTHLVLPAPVAAALASASAETAAVYRPIRSMVAQVLDGSLTDIVAPAADVRWAPQVVLRRLAAVQAACMVAPLLPVSIVMEASAVAAVARASAAMRAAAAAVAATVAAVLVLYQALFRVSLAAVADPTTVAQAK